MQEQDPRRLFLQAIIHVAVGFYHCQRGNSPGAAGQIGKAVRKLIPYLPAYDSIDTKLLYADVLAIAAKIDAGSPLSEYPRIHFVAPPDDGA